MLETNLQESSNRPAVALCADLMFASRLRASAEAAGRTMALVRSAAEVERAVRDGAGRVFLDLETRGLDAPALIRAVLSGAPDTTIIAFGRHTDPGALAAASAAGAQRVLARSAFVRELPVLLQG